MSAPDEPVDPQTLPGCGFAAYAAILAVFGVLGLVGMGSATLAMLQAVEEVGPARLMPGTQVAVWQMAPMRKAKLVEMTEVPLAWHDESPLRDGSSACALMDDRLIRVQDGQGWTLAYRDIAAIEEEELSSGGHRVTVTGAASDGGTMTIPCLFGVDEGGPKLARQLRSELERASGEHGADGSDAEQHPDDGGDPGLGDDAQRSAQGGSQRRP